MYEERSETVEKLRHHHLTKQEEVVFEFGWLFEDSQTAFLTPDDVRDAPRT